MPITRETGLYEVTSVAGEEVRAFLPHPLPPRLPPLEFTGELPQRLQDADRALAQLDLAGVMVPSIDWFLYGFIRKEAVLSSRIEGTQATLLDLLTFDAREQPEARPDADLEEVCNYLEALTFARAELDSPKGLPLSMRLLNGVHRRLMTGVRGANKRPGEVRRSQNWIGGTRPGTATYVPPPPHVLPRMLSDFERYLHGADDELPPLIRVALLHGQFESLHPYLDGNGRTGRMLITLLLEQWKLLEQPLLYLSLYFMRHRGSYYRHLGGIREGNWEAWVSFFLEGVATIAAESVSTTQQLFALVTEDRARTLAAQTSSVSGLRLLELLPRRLIFTAKQATAALGSTKPTTQKAITLLEGLGVLVETTGRKRDRTYRYERYLEILGSGEG
jgi:cell filamentation protein, protein adenylyltransferase